LIGQHDKKFRLLSVDCVLNDPRGDFVHNVDRIPPNSLTARTRRANASNEGYSSRADA
jgi:hypothetical protein